MRTATPSPAWPWRRTTTSAPVSTCPVCSSCSACTTPADGGDSIFVDGYAVAEQLRAASPADFAVLTTIAVPFATRNRDSDHRCCAPVLELDAAGEIANVRYTWWLRNPMRGDSATIKAFYAAFKRFQRLANDPGNQLRLRLQAGEMACFDNRRMLHGRTAFDPSSGRRWLRGCYGEREELESRLRMLGRAERTAPGGAGFAAGGAGRHLTARRGVGRCPWQSHGKYSSPPP